MSRKIIIFAFALSFAVASLCACGKRPGQLEPPPGVSENDFPLIYPDPSTDPKP